MIYDGMRISVEQAKAKIEERTEKTGEETRMATNPYNQRVIRLDFVDKSVSPPNFETVWLERLTENTEKQLLATADETVHGRYW